MMDPVSFPGALKIGFAGLAATLLLSVQVQTYAQQSGVCGTFSSFEPAPIPGSLLRDVP